MSKVKSEVFLLYNEIAKPYIEVMVFENDKFYTNKVDLSLIELEDGVPSNLNLLEEPLKKLIPIGCKQVKFLINSSNVIKSVNVYPTMSFSKVKAMYEKDINIEFPKSKLRYVSFNTNIKTSLEQIFYTYFVPMNLKTFALKICKLIKVKCNGVGLLPMFIYDSVKKKLTGDFIYSYEDNDCIHSVISYSKKFVGFYTSLNNEEDLIKKTYMYASKHLYELEKRNIEKITTNITDKYTVNNEYKVIDIKLDPKAFKGLL